MLKDVPYLAKKLEPRCCSCRVVTVDSRFEDKIKLGGLRDEIGAIDRY
jgi:hypothetical protein